MAGNRTLYANGSIFTASSTMPAWAEAMLIDGSKIAYVGDLATARRIAGSESAEIDLEGSLVLPGFVDGHAHPMLIGEWLGQLDLLSARSLDEIQQLVRDWRQERPSDPRIQAHGWKHVSIPGGRPTRQMMDAVLPDTPFYARSFDGHSIWLNSAALREVGIDANTTDPQGGSIARDATTGEPTGYVDETAQHAYVWPFLEGLVDDAGRDQYLARAVEHAAACGVTAMTEMMLTESGLAAMARAEAAGALKSRIVGYFRIYLSEDPKGNLDQIERAIELSKQYTSPFLRVTGVKFIVDGTIDGCTAAVGEPYSDGTLADAIWDYDTLAPAVAAADAGGLQVAMHAIGDEAIRIAIDSIENAMRENGPRARRHRIEHLEYVKREDIARIAALGITVSMQPEHADPAIAATWQAMLGDARIDRAFPATEVTDAGAVLAFGTDAPVTSLSPLPNLYVAATRRSILEPGLTKANIPNYTMSVGEAVRHATYDAAWACSGEQEFGELRPGLSADFVVVDRNVVDSPPEQLLEASVLKTVLAGKTVYAKS